MRNRGRLRSDGGFTLVELLAAMLFLVVGIAGVMTMLNTANRTTTTSNARLGANNLARELMEQTRTMAYGGLTSAGIQADMISRGYGAVSGAWKITYRKIEYTVAVQACVYDDPVDGIAAAAPENTPCSTTTPTVPADPDGDDFRRVTFTFTSTDNGRTRTTKQTELVVNPSGGLGPRITSFTGPNPITAGTSATYNITTASNAQTVKWTSDDGFSLGTATGSKTTWSFPWSLKAIPDPANPYPIPQGTVLDGTYQLVAQAINARGIPGEAKVFVVTVERSRPFIPRNAFKGGHLTRDGNVVELRWEANPERDIKGYQVFHSSDSTFGNGDDSLACPTTAGTWLAASVLTCRDEAHPGSPGVTSTYFLVALDQDETSVPRALTVGPPSSQPAAPGSLTATDSNGFVKLSWTAPTSGTTPTYYRIYRDGTAYANRYAEVSGSVLTWTEPVAGFSRKYWVVAVNSSFNESAVVGPVQVGSGA